MNRTVHKAKVVLNHVHAAMTTGKSLAAGVGAALTAVTVAMSAPAWLVALAAAATAVSTWEIPYKPFELDEDVSELE